MDRFNDKSKCLTRALPSNNDRENKYDKKESTMLNQNQKRITGKMIGSKYRNEMNIMAKVLSRRCA